MKTRKRNIYPIGHARRAACLAVCALLLAPSASSAQAGCESIGGGGDEYCESIPGPGGDRDAAPPKIRGGLSEPTSRSLERAGAGAVRQVQSPERERRSKRRPGSKRRPEAASAAPTPGTGDAGGGSILPYILAGLTLALLVAALARRLRGTGSPGPSPR